MFGGFKKKKTEKEKKMMLLLFLATSAHALSWWGWTNYDPHCKYSRMDAVQCFEKYVDLNHDGVITANEVEAAKTRYITGAFKWFLRIISWEVDTSTAKIFHDCDYNHDGKFTQDDFIKSKKTCIPTQAGLCMIKYVCDRHK